MIDQQEASRRVKLWEQGYWEIPEAIDTAEFDFSWRPHKFDRPYIHQFGTQWQKTGGPRFVIPENEGIKYQSSMIAKKLPEPEKFKVLIEQYDVDFDFSWHPDDTEPAFIWTFGNQFQNSFEMPTLEYHVSGAHERKHLTDLIARLKAKNEYWNQILPIENYGWDKTWCPDIYEPPYIYVWGNQWNSGEIEPTLEYRVPGATEIKYMKNFTPRVKKDMSNWKILVPIDESSFDFSWRPSPYDPPMIYVWGNQWNNATTEPTIEYCSTEVSKMLEQISNVVERKYMSDRVANVASNMENWKIKIPVDENGFDFSWRPNPYDPPMIYVWGNQWNEATVEPTVEYHAPGATQIKYMDDMVATVAPIMDNWNMLIPCTFDFSWRPNPYEPPYIYVWGNQWHDYSVEPTLEYQVPGATEKKYMTDRTAECIPDVEKWKVLIPVDETSFDFSWRPSPYDPPMIYVWGNQWNNATTEPTIEYHMPGGTERKYMTDVVAKVIPDLSKWKMSSSSGYRNFDFSWRPNPHSPAQIYQWEDGGPIYSMSGATEIVFMEKPHFNEEIDTTVVPKYYIKTTLDDLVKQHPNEVFWALNPDLNYDKFDFSWKPNDKNFRHINVFGNKVSKDLHTYYINGPLYTSGYKDINYVEDWEVEIVTDIDMFYILKGNEAGVGRFEELKKRYPKLQKTRYLNSWVDTINRCLRKTTTKFAWFLSSEVDYSDFKFDYYPASWNRDKIHVFGNQWTHWGNTYLINKDTFEKDTQYVKVIEHLPTINHVRNKKTKLSEYLFDLIYIDHGNENHSLERLKSLVSEERLHVIKFDTDYFTTLAKWFEEIPDYLIANEQMSWICSSLCDYSDFDFSWTPDPFIKQKIHVFATKINGTKQNFGDTFLVDIVEFRYQHTGIEDMKSYPHGMNMVSYLNVERLPEFQEIVTEEKAVDI